MPHSRSRRKKARRTPKAHPRGVIEITDAGYGFVQTAEGEFFIPAAKTLGSFDGDVVEISQITSNAQSGQTQTPSVNRPVARVVRVVSRAHETLVGRYEIAEPFGVVVPVDSRIHHDVFTLRREAPHVKDGDIVRVRITTYPSRREPAQGVVEQILGHEGDRGVDVALVISRYKLETEFTSAALKELEDLHVDAEGAIEHEHYRDLTDRVVFTIDPEDARDFDDALSLECVVLPHTCKFESDCSDSNTYFLNGKASEGAESPNILTGHVVDLRTLPTLALESENGALARKTVAAGQGLWRLGVHIADVSHYVVWDSALDLNARRRATSVYLVDRVIPMLPEKLSNEICSLRPGESRRTMSVDLYLDDQARLVCADIYPSVIKSCARLTYGQVQQALDALHQGSFDTTEENEAQAAHHHATSILPCLEVLNEIAHKLHDARRKRGGVDFKSEEAKVRLDDQGNPVSVDIRIKNEATSLVEESMIAANEAVACFMRDSGIASIYRVHEEPAPGDLADIKPILQEFAYDRVVNLSSFSSGNPFVIQKVLDAAKGRHEEYLISSLIVRAMKRAVYRDVCSPHYGLASTAYTHFTSPIRRYPDLMVHRMLKSVLFGRTAETSAEEAMLAQIAEHSSQAERTADAAARESQELKLYELLEQRVGQEEEGLVSGVVARGFYVRLFNTAEGFVTLQRTGEYWIFDATCCTLTGSDTGDVVRLGMRVRVRIKEVRPLERQADFVLIGK